MEHSVDAYLNNLRAEAHAAQRQLRMVSAAFRLCESPLEEQLLLTYLQRYPSQGHPITDDDPVFMDEDLSKDLWVNFKLQQKIRIDCQNFRMDFHFMQMAEKTKDLPCRCVRSVAVEVDGHDFHERTKEQARKDRARDRLMQLHGLYVLRFTGSEVYRNPVRVVEEIREFVMRPAA